MTHADLPICSLDDQARACQSAPVSAAEEWLPIEYREFYDFPRSFFVRVRGRWLFLDAKFDEAADEYGKFDVFDMDQIGPADVAPDWTAARTFSAACLGSALLGADSFDPSRRRAVASSAVAPFIA